MGHPQQSSYTSRRRLKRWAPNCLGLFKRSAWYSWGQWPTTSALTTKFGWALCKQADRLMDNKVGGGGGAENWRLKHRWLVATSDPKRKASDLVVRRTLGRRWSCCGSAGGRTNGGHLSPYGSYCSHGFSDHFGVRIHGSSLTWSIWSLQIFHKY